MGKNSKYKEYRVKYLFFSQLVKIIIYVMKNEISLWMFCNKNMIFSLLCIEYNLLFNERFQGSTMSDIEKKTAL